jgi:hypothetical protein
LAGFSPLENAIHVDSGPAKQIVKIDAIRNQTALL